MSVLLSRALQHSLDIDAEGRAAQATMPRHYRKVEIKYSKFGVEDFDFAFVFFDLLGRRWSAEPSFLFSFYNKTSYSGLETHILNSYTNSLLQVLRFVRPIRKLAEGHIWTNCARENCFLCEAGFLFKMLRDAKGVNCQASNFSRAFSCNAQGTARSVLSDMLS